MSRIILLGQSSFIAQAMAKAASERKLEYLALPHNGALDILSPNDVLVNFSLSPAYRSDAYSEANDCDLRAARIAARAGASFIMLSTRRVYGTAGWNADESQRADGDDSAYGQNKARTEIAVQEALEGRGGVFRLSNIFGYEYDRQAFRWTFLGALLTSLKHKNTILFDMNAQTRRDFLPVELCADMLLDRALARTAGIYNLGSGLPLTCGQLADWIREGYEGGKLICDPNIIRDEFYLNMEKWRAEFPLPVNEAALQEYCIGLGRRLKCEKF
jgi:UDP-glucose 4-epimerase